MVGWYDPLQLLARRPARPSWRTSSAGGRTFACTRPGGAASRRSTTGSGRTPRACSGSTTSPTWATASMPPISVARALAAARLTVAAARPAAGADACPVARCCSGRRPGVSNPRRRRAICERLVDPYEMALPSRRPGRSRRLACRCRPARPTCWRMPGNHDWYDGLQSFVKVFCRRARVGGWVTPQARSYFAVQLPHRTWLFGPGHPAERRPGRESAGVSSAARTVARRGSAW